MVNRQIYGFAASAQHAPGVSSVSNNVLGWSNQDHVSSAAGGLGDRLALRDVSGLIKFPSYLLALQFLVHQPEGFVQGFLVIFLLIGFKTSQDFHKGFLDVLTNLVTYIAGQVLPWPSKTPNSEILSPRFNSWMAASSMDLRQPLSS